MKILDVYISTSVNQFPFDSFQQEELIAFCTHWSRGVTLFHPVKFLNVVELLPLHNVSLTVAGSFAWYFRTSEQLFGIY